MEESTLVLDKEKEVAAPGSAARLIREVRRYTRRKFSAEDKIRIVLEGFRKEIPVSDFCRRESISSAIYYNWLKDFMEAGGESTGMSFSDAGGTENSPFHVLSLAKDIRGGDIAEKEGGKAFDPGKKKVVQFWR